MTGREFRRRPGLKIVNAVLSEARLPCYHPRGPGASVKDRLGVTHVTNWAAWYNVETPCTRDLSRQMVLVLDKKFPEEELVHMVNEQVTCLECLTKIGGR